MSSESVKVTVLAFFYVPLNLATSIFGMNIQQLNGSGPRIWVFFTTAIAALLITGGSWLCSKSLATPRAVVWYRERAVAEKAKDEQWNSQEYGLLLRMAMLVWLVRNGHTSWMWKSGAWAAILTNSKTNGICYNSGVDVEITTACKHVAKRYRPSSFTLNPKDMLIWSTPLRYSHCSFSTIALTYHCPADLCRDPQGQKITDATLPKGVHDRFHDKI